MPHAHPHPAGHNRLRRRLLALAASAALAVGGLAAAPPPVASAADCDVEQAKNNTSLNPVGVVVGTTKVKTMTFAVQTLAGCTDVVVASVQYPRGTKRLLLDKVGTTQGGFDLWEAKLSIKPTSLENSDAGAWPVRYTVVFGEVVQTLHTDAQVQRAARISFNAGPEPVRGDKITYSGTLERANWNTGRYAGWTNHRVEVESYEPQDHEFQPVTTLVTGKGGAYRATQRYRGDGQYRSHSAPSLTTQSAYSRVDTVAAAG
jgi:hypothetical protein